MEAFVLTLVILCPLVGLLIGRSRNCQNAGLLLGFFFGPLGWVITALLDYRPHCPECMEVIRMKASLCPHCKTRIRWHKGKPTVAPSVESS